jgi:hypothetical protein
MNARFALRAGLVVGALLFCAAPSGAETYPPPFPRDGAKKILDNEVMNVWDVTWTKGKAGGLHQLQYDQLSVTLTEGAIKVTRPDKGWTIDQTKLGAVNLQPKGTVIAEEGISDTPARTMVVEIKTYKTPVLDPKVVAGLKEARAKGIQGQFPREGAVKLFETDRLTVWDDNWPIGKEGPMHAHYQTIVGLFYESADSERPVGWANFSLPRLPPHTEPAQKVLRHAVFLELK